MGFPWLILDLLSREDRQCIDLSAGIASRRAEGREKGIAGTAWQRLGWVDRSSTLPPSPDSSPTMGAEEESISEEEAEKAYIRSLSHTPSKQARYLELKAKRDRFKARPSVARIPDLTAINEALDHAEALGKT